RTVIPSLTLSTSPFSVGCSPSPSPSVIIPTAAVSGGQPTGVASRPVLPAPKSKLSPRLFLHCCSPSSLNYQIIMLW
ncbi:hypothetical protein LINGRAHAP2_LOCUS23100, partial [Linum grandiflorum]